MKTSLLPLCLFVLSSASWLRAQSIVFVSPSSKGLLSMSCAEGSLGSFEQQHYLAAAHYLTSKLCPRSHIESVVGVWNNQAENSGMIDGCSGERAREIGALLAKYYHQEAALIFDRANKGTASLVSFHSNQPLSVIALMMAQAKVYGATVIPREHDTAIWIVAADATARFRALNLFSRLQGDSLREEAGTAELIGDSDRAKARKAFSAILARAPAKVRMLDSQMYSQQFHDLGLYTAPAQ